MLDLESYRRKNAAEMKGTYIAVEGTGTDQTVLYMRPDSCFKIDIVFIYKQGRSPEYRENNTGILAQNQRDL